MASPDSDDGSRPPARFYSQDGRSYWSAEQPPDDRGAVFEEPKGIMGTTIRFMPDYGADVPLWDGGGLIYDDPKWLHRHLNLEPALVAELAAWGRAWDDRDSWDGTCEQWRREGQRLFEAVVARLPKGLTLVDLRGASER